MKNSIFTHTCMRVFMYTKIHTPPFVLLTYKLRILFYRKHCLEIETFFKFPNFHKILIPFPSMVSAVISAMEKNKEKIKKLVFKAGFEKYTVNESQAMFLNKKIENYIEFSKN